MNHFQLIGRAAEPLRGVAIEDRSALDLEKNYSYSQLQIFADYYHLKKDQPREILIREIATCNVKRHGKLIARMNPRINEKDYKDLLIACRKGDLNKISQFIQTFGSSALNMVVQNSRTPLTTAAVNNQIEAVKLLIKNGADIYIRDSQNTSALYWGCRNGYLPIVRLLLDAGGDLNERNGSGETLLMIAGKYGQVSIVRELLSRGVNVNALNNNLQTVLHVTAQGPGDVNNRADCILFVCDREIIPIDALDKFNRTAVWYACGRGQGEIPVVIALLQVGANYKQVVSKPEILQEAISEFGGEEAVLKAQIYFYPENAIVDEPPCQLSFDTRKDTTVKCTAAVISAVDRKILIIFEKSFPINLRRWGFPKGHYKESETTKDCIYREVCEEIGLEISKYPFKTIEYGDRQFLIINKPTNEIKLHLGPEVLESKWVDVRWLQQDVKNRPEIYNASIKKIASILHVGIL